MNRFFRWFGLPGRLVLTILISIYAIGLAIIFPSVPRYIAVVAMILSTLGDIILMDYDPLTRHFPFRGFLAGSVVFVISHIVYISAFVVKIIEAGHSYLNVGVIAALGLFISSAVAISIISFARHAKEIEILPLAILYLFVICVNCSSVFSCAVSLGGVAWISAVGILSFLISDIFIVLNKVCDIHSRSMKNLIWWFYPIGQILLLFGV